MTAIEHRIGDLFAQLDVDAYAHGVNCQGVMSGGIAVPFKGKHPLMYSAYRQVCDQLGLALLGDVMPWSTEPFCTYRWVYNLFTQGLPGPNASLTAIRSSTQKMFAHAQWAGVSSIAMPRIGAGIGGLDWNDVNDELTWVADQHPSIQLVVVTLPEPS